MTPKRNTTTAPVPPGFQSSRGTTRTEAVQDDTGQRRLAVA